jgi:hypothetical protein
MMSFTFCASGPEHPAVKQNAPQRSRTGTHRIHRLDESRPSFAGRIHVSIDVILSATMRKLRDLEGNQTLDHGLARGSTNTTINNRPSANHRHGAERSHRS